MPGCLPSASLVLCFQICMPGAGKPFPKGRSYWWMAMQATGQGSLKHTAWDDPAPLLCPCFPMEGLIISKYNKHLFLYQRGQIMGSNTCSFAYKNQVPNETIFLKKWNCVIYRDSAETCGDKLIHNISLVEFLKETCWLISGVLAK